MHEYLVSISTYTNDGVVRIRRIVDGCVIGEPVYMNIRDKMRIFTYLSKHRARYLYTSHGIMVFSLKKG